MLLLAAPLWFALLVLISFAPGFWFVRRARWSPLERLSAAIGLSLVIAYLGGALLHLAQVSYAWSWLLPPSGAVALGLARDDVRRLWASRAVRATIAGWGALLGLGALLLMVTQHYSGAGWSGDWLEHYERTLYFLHHRPADTILTGDYAVPARPPLMNLVAAEFLGIAGEGFERFQAAFLFLNLLVVVPCALLASRFVPRGGRPRLDVLAAWLALVPFVLVNATYTWTKLLTAFFVLLALAFYLRGLRQPRSGGIAVAAVSMAAALLTHYSAGPYALLLVLHQLWRVAQQPRRIREVLLAGTLAAAVLASWFAWALWEFGAERTLASNTAVTDARKLSPAGNVGKIATNVVTTIVPHPLRTSAVEFTTLFDQPNRFGRVRDAAFTLYQSNLLLLLGSAGWLGAAMVAARRLRFTPPPERAFWCLFVAVVPLLGIAVHGAIDGYGVAHVCLQPFALVGLALLAANVGLLPRWLRVALPLALAVDAALGLVLQFRMQMHDFRLEPLDGAFIVSWGDGLLTRFAMTNSLAKHAHELRFWSDHVPPALAVAAGVLALGLLATAVVRVATATAAIGAAHRRSWVAAGGFGALAVLACSDRLAGFRLDPPAAPTSARTAAARDTIAALEREIRRQPESAATHEKLGHARVRIGALPEALVAFADAFLLDPHSGAARHALDLLLRFRGASLDTSPVAAAERVRQNPADAEAQCALALVRRERGFVATARRELQGFLARRPDVARAHDLLAGLLADAGQLDNAIAHARRALALEPESSDYLEHLFVLLQAQGKTTSEIRRIIESTRRAPP